MYLRLSVSPCDEPWWYMVPMIALPKVLTHGGWAPPVAFDATGECQTLYEVPLSLNVYLKPAGGILVFVDGSTDDRQGIAAGSLIAGLCSASRASLALPGMTGAESSELLGIVLGLWVCCQSCRMHSRFVLLVDSANGLKHVFQDQAPSDADGWDLWPAIVLARKLVSLLRELNIQVSAVKVESRKNLAHHIAKSEMQYRRDRSWGDLEERWPEGIPCVFREVWYDVARSRRRSRRRCESMDTGTRCLSRGYEFSDDVLSALDSFARGVA